MKESQSKECHTVLRTTRSKAIQSTTSHSLLSKRRSLSFIQETTASVSSITPTAAPQRYLPIFCLKIRSQPDSSDPNPLSIQSEVHQVLMPNTSCLVPRTESHIFGTLPLKSKSTSAIWVFLC